MPEKFLQLSRALLESPIFGDFFLPQSLRPCPFRTLILVGAIAV